MNKIELLNNLKDEYFKLYGSLGASEKDYLSLLNVIEKRIEDRSDELRGLDHRNHDWYMSEKMVGMMLYVDLFSNDLKQLPGKIPYLKELGVTFVHLMPLLKPREGENDGGYAVEDYLDIDPKIGELEDFIMVLNEFRNEGIDVCIDFVLNHTSDSHDWAKRALEGDKLYQDMYIMYDSRDVPDKFDKTVPDVLPDKSPGNFTYKAEIKKWVYTSFSSFQWDLNFRNPRVFENMVDILLHLANYGVNILRLDAIAFMWKEEGTDCRNLKQVHDILHMMHLIKEVACPSLALLGEAIVQPDEIIKYFGEEKTECGLLYNANFMVNIFNSFSTRDTRLMAIDNMRFKIPYNGCFVNYVRCHDDIGWGLNETGLIELGMDPHSHKMFLIDFYSGRYKGSFSMGDIYQYNENTEDARINGTLASLLGLEKAIDENDNPGVYDSIRRIKLAHGLIFSQRGIPQIYSGDEIGAINDRSYLQDEHKRNEGRWVHRKKFDWVQAESRKKTFSTEGIIFNGLKKMIEIRKNEPLFSGHLDSKVVSVDNYHVYVMHKSSDDEDLICIYNFSENNEYVKTRYFTNLGLYGNFIDMITGKKIDFGSDEVHLYPYEFLWLKNSRLIRNMSV